MPAKKTTKPKVVKVSDLEWRDMESAVPRFYSNNVQIRMTVMDLVFRFGEFSEEKDGGFCIREVARVSMSPQHAKALRKVLNQYIDQYETDHGRIPSPQEGDTEGPS